MIIAMDFFKDKGECQDIYQWFIENYSTSAELSVICESLIKDNNFEWITWLLSKLFTKKQTVKYAMFAAEQIIDEFEKNLFNNKTARKSIESAKKYLNNPTIKNKDIAGRAFKNSYEMADYIKATYNMINVSVLHANTLDFDAGMPNKPHNILYVLHAIKSDAIKIKLIRYGISLIEE